MGSGNSVCEGVEVLTLEEIHEEIRKCKRCELYKTKTNYVPGEGNERAKIVFVGEAPGREEDLQGRPFVGAAGQYLTKTLEKYGMRRSEVFITNILKCRPPNNRDPKPEEIEKCFSYLIRQLYEIKPDVIVCLGRHSAREILNFFGKKFRGISADRGKIFEAELDGKKVKIIPTYHPAAVLYKPQLKEYFEEDIRKVASFFKRKTLLDFIGE